LSILGPTASAGFLAALFTYTIVAIGKQKMMTWAYAFVATVTIAGYAIFIPNYGMWAAAAMSLFSETLIGIIAAIVVLRATAWRPNFRLTGKVLIASLGMSAVLLAIRDASAWVLVPVGSATYLAILGVLGGPSPKSLVHIFRPSTNVLE
jgi:O-antigen/teichoic acid export membrane protein